MDFELNDDQVALQEGVRSLCLGRFDSAAVRAAIDHGGVDRARWRELAETGVFSLLLPEAEGGVGLGWADAVVVFEQLGRSAVPGPLVATLLAAALVPGAAAGEVVVGLVERPEHGNFVVEHPTAIDVLLLLDDDGVHRVDLEAAVLVPETMPLDPLTPVAQVDDLPVSATLAGPDTAAEWRMRGGVLTSALQLGLAWGATDLAVAYAKEREQFGRVIGSFQAVKHLCADMISRVEVARAAVYLAGVALDDPEVADHVRAASAARIVSSQAASANGKDCVQVHGGMGYTWEVDAHLYLKRAWVLETQFGTPDEHAEVMATLV